MRYTIATLSKTNITSNGYREGTLYAIETAYGMPQTGSWDIIGFDDYDEFYDFAEDLIDQGCECLRFEFANDDEAYDFATSVVKRIANLWDVACPCIDYLYE